MTNRGIWLGVETKKGKTMLYFGQGGIVAIKPEMVGGHMGSRLENDEGILLCISEWEPTVIMNMITKDSIKGRKK